MASIPVLTRTSPNDFSVRVVACCQESLIADNFFLSDVFSSPCPIFKRAARGRGAARHCCALRWWGQQPTRCWSICRRLRRSVRILLRSAWTAWETSTLTPTWMSSSSSHLSPLLSLTGISLPLKTLSLRSVLFFALPFLTLIVLFWWTFQACPGWGPVRRRWKQATGCTPFGNAARG